MHHLAKISFGKFSQIPFRAECACGTAGDFASNEEARNYLAGHLTRLQGINSGEFVDETVQALPVPEAEPVPIPGSQIPVQQQSRQEEQESAEEAPEEKAESAG